MYIQVWNILQKSGGCPKRKKYKTAKQHLEGEWNGKYGKLLERLQIQRRADLKQYFPVLVSDQVVTVRGHKSHLKRHLSRTEEYACVVLQNNVCLHGLT